MQPPATNSNDDRRGNRAATSRRGDTSRPSGGGRRGSDASDAPTQVIPKVSGAPPRGTGNRPPTPPPPSGPGGGGSGGGGSSRPPRGRSRWRTYRRVLYSLIAAVIIVPLVAFLAAYVVVDVPSAGDIKTNQVATILASDGSTVISKVVPPEGNRTDVDIDQVPEHVRNAVLSAEDRDFYTNPGFSVTGFLRAARDNVLGKESAGGGSTITQQYVKNALVGSDRTITRKMHELVVSAKMARNSSKDEILEAYLNTIYFGRGAYGIAAASNAYFDKPVEDLTVAEGAVLASSIQQPSGLDPETNPTGAQSRWNYVLDGMVTSGTLSAEERAGHAVPDGHPACVDQRPQPGQRARGPDQGAGAQRAQPRPESASSSSTPRACRSPRPSTRRRRRPRSTR